MGLEYRITDLPGYGHLRFTESSGLMPIGEGIEWAAKRGGLVWSARDAAATMIAEGPERDWTELFATRTTAIYFKDQSMRKRRLLVAFDDAYQPGENLVTGIIGTAYRRTPEEYPNGLFDRYQSDIQTAIDRANRTRGIRIVEVPKEKTFFNRGEKTDQRLFRNHPLTSALFPGIEEQLAEHLWTVKPRDATAWNVIYDLETPRELRDQKLTVKHAAVRMVTIATSHFYIEADRPLNSQGQIRAVTQVTPKMMGQ